jgi:hypothetical protein
MVTDGDSVWPVWRTWVAPTQLLDGGQWHAPAQTATGIVDGVELGWREMTTVMENGAMEVAVTS